MKGARVAELEAALRLIKEHGDIMSQHCIAQNYMIGKPDRPASPTLSDYIWVLGDCRNIAERVLAGKPIPESLSIETLRNWPRHKEASA